MSRSITQPIGQVRLTNVAVVRLNRTGKRFELACYRNKVVNWRNKVETDINEVLQIATIFQNVSKGVLANKKDVVKAFGTEDETEVIKLILEKGELQVSDKERKALYDSLFRDVATIISEKCVNPTSNRPYTVSMIENAMREVHFSLNPNKAAKVQALELVPRLKEVMPITRARMMLRVAANISHAQQVREAMEGLGIDHFEKDSSADGARDEYTLEFLIDPGLFRGVEEAIQECTGGAGRVEVLQMCVQQEGDAGIDLEAARKGMMALKVKEEEEIRSGKAKMQGGAAAAAAKAGDDEESDGSAEEVEIMPAAGRRGGARGGAADGAGGDGGGGGGKKSKKAKRREKEAAIEREARVLQEEERKERRLKQHPQQGAASSNTNEGDSGAAAESTAALPAPPDGGAKLRCNGCGIGPFPDTASYREHFKSDLHRYNLKLKMKGQPPISAEEFKTVDAEGFFFDLG